MLGRKRLLSGTCAALAVVAAAVVLPAATGPALADTCPTPNPNATAPSQVTAAERTTIINQHNQARAATGAVPAIRGLVWDATLANKAQGWANIIGPSKHSECHSGSFSSGQGENIADFGTVSAGVQFWYNEKSSYHYPTPVAAGDHPDRVRKGTLRQVLPDQHRPRLPLLTGRQRLGTAALLTRERRPGRSPGPPSAGAGPCAYLACTPPDRADCGPVPTAPMASTVNR